MKGLALLLRKKHKGKNSDCLMLKQTVDIEIILLQIVKSTVSKYIQGHSY